jgi:hypothetical protein
MHVCLADAQLLKARAEAREAREEAARAREALVLERRRREEEEEAKRLAQVNADKPK